MKNETILKKAIEKAVENDWAYDLFYESKSGSNNTLGVGIDDIIRLYSIEEIIFSHQFAKAFWGEEYYKVSESSDFNEFGLPRLIKHHEPLKKYLYHLQQMVLKKDPIKYLEKFLT